MIDRRAVSRYAAALFDLAERRQEVDDIEMDFQLVRNLILKHPEISNLVSNSTIALSEKEDFIDKILPKEISKDLVYFLKVLIKKKRFGGLRYIQEEFHKLYERKKGVVEVEAVSAVGLSEALEQRIRTVLAKKLKAEIRLVQKVEPDLIGGIILRFDGREINASFRSRLQELRQLLMA